ncbi:FimV/HubP family polar landmark protein [Thioalkalivibrio paradoxus]|uniref:FimV N-terminal domain-containing protein n=1 Tax=Thioalkalivibrio paradoxus ARh 1 TaxID=713585 RepID=W0DT82_9GAMM|nr:FimV/HubP family polar landmark protein [Thioalkalivibrio paradoxus]AHF00159.1 hypothetical protein THITH_10780 [Thioalkalivibrio paradoxus ARh 1]
MRRIIIALTLWLLAGSAMANVSLGDIDVRSFLNQPLQAQVRAEGAALDNVEFRLAPEQDYRRAGLARGALPPDLEIRVEGTGSSRLIRLTTQRPVREPYLGVLLEARWGGGRILREFTLLLDPPVAFEPERSAPPVVTRPAETVPAEPARATTYRVRRGDTLLTIVRQQGYVGVTSEQAMLAILEANPQAFVGGNINQLRADVELRIPAQEDVAARSSDAARAEVRRQTQAWRERTAPRPEPVPASPPPAAPEPVTPAPEEVPPTPDPVPPSEEPEPEAPPADALPTEEPPVDTIDGLEIAMEDRLEILGGPGAPIGAASSQVVEEALLSQQAAMSELREELVALRTELAERDQLLTLVSNELAQLESRMRELQQSAGAGFPGAGQSVGDMAFRDRILADPLLLMMAATMLLLFMLLLVALFRPVRLRQPEGDAGSPGIREAARAAEAPAAPERAPQQPGETRTGSVAGAALAGAAAGTAAGTAAARAPADAPSAVNDQATLGGVPSGEIDVNEGEDDVLADVDLYLAYGMNDQAITALNKAIDGGTDTLEYRMRLLDAHAANNDTDAVRQAAADVRARLGPDDDAARAQVAAVEARFLGEQPQEPQEFATEPDEPEAGDSSVHTGAQDAPEKAVPDPGSLDFDAPEELAPEPETQVEAGQDARRDEDEDHLLRFDVEGLDDDSSARQVDKPHGESEGEGIPALDLPPLEGAEGGSQDADTAAPADTEVAAGVASDTSEVGMKLSLAEAFADLGDREGALALLDEVMPAATQQQKEQADAIRQRLGQEDAG